MLETSKAVAIMLVFAILVQFLVDRVKDIVGEKVMGYVKAPVWAALLGVLFAFLFCSVSASPPTRWKVKRVTEGRKKPSRFPCRKTKGLTTKLFQIFCFP